MLNAGLTPDRGPPIHVPFRFLFSAPIFLAATGLLLLVSPSLGSVHSYDAYGIVHLFTLGFLTMTMTGAFFQMVPVVAGLIVPKSRIFAWIIHAPLTLGASILGFGFYAGATSFAAVGGGLAAFSLAVFAAGFLLLLRKVDRSNRTAAGMRHALWALLAGLLAAIAIAGNHGGWWALPEYGSWVSIHLTMAPFAWVGILIQSVTFQVIPMFLITGEYPTLLRRHGTRGLLGLAILRSLMVTALPTGLFPSSIALQCVDGGILLLMGAHAITTLRLISKRRRRIPDPLADFFRLAVISLLVGLILWACMQGSRLFPIHAWTGRAEMLYGSAFVFYLLGFAGSAINGMLYRIVPFLVYFHLTASGINAPTMKEMISERLIRVQLWLHGLAVVATGLLPLLVKLSPDIPVPQPAALFQKLAGLLIVLSAMVLLWNLGQPLKILIEERRKARAENF